MDHLSARQRFLWRIREILEDPNGCSLCPMVRRESHCEGSFYGYRKSGMGETCPEARPRHCETCLAIVGLLVPEDEWNWTCPCYELGRDEAKKRAWLAIEAELVPKEG